MTDEEVERLEEDWNSLWNPQAKADTYVAPILTEKRKSLKLTMPTYFSIHRIFL
jgi:hypothetical protein